MVQEQTDINEFWKTMGVHTTTLKTARSVVELCFQCHHVPCLIGEAGTGKTALFKQITQDFSWNLLVYYLAHREPEDISGVPVPNKTTQDYQFFPERQISEILQSGKSTVILFDEWNRGDKAVMNAAFTTMEQRRLGNIVLPDNVYIAAAMNPSEGTYVVNEAEKDPAFRRRLCFIGVRVDKTVWVDYARTRGAYHPSVVDFVDRQGEGALMDIAARDAGKVYACPASYEKASDAFYNVEKKLGVGETNWDDVRPALRIQLAGYLGTGVSEELLGFYENNMTLINPDAVIMRYHEQARDQILALITQNQHGILARAVDSVATAFAMQDYNIDDCVDNLGEFADDLPHDISQAFFTKLSMALDGADNPKRRDKVLQTLKKSPAFRAAYLRISLAHERVEDEIEGS